MSAQLRPEPGLPGAVPAAVPAGSPGAPDPTIRTVSPGSGGRTTLPALDGVRALAIAGVLAYHLGAPGSAGGFLGVDTFFALSGFLITTLLLGEKARSGSIAPGAFWARRARRLLPALFLVVASVTVAVWITGLDSVYPGLRGDAVSTGVYAANWHFVATQTDYFAASAHPSPLLHTWSLAIEEQFYIVWPMALFLVLRGAGATRRRCGVLAAACLAGAGASAWWMAHLYANGSGAARAYYGTDTRAQAILIGAALAFALRARDASFFGGGERSNRAREDGATGARALDAIGVAGLVGSVLAYHLLGQLRTITFRGGFALAAAAAAALIASSVLRPAGPVAHALALRPVAYVGRISYGIYLWHWPTVVLLDHARTGLSGFALAAARLAVILTVSVASYHLVERPIRSGALRRLPVPGRPEIVALGATAACLLAVVLLLTTTTAVPAEARAPATPAGSVPAGGAAASGRRLAAFARQESALAADTRLLLVGDSMAYTAGVGMGDEAATDHVWFADEGIRSCSVGVTGPYVVQGRMLSPASACTEPPSSPASWAQLWQSWVDQFDPDVAVYLARLDLVTQDRDGSLLHVGQRAYDSSLVANLDRAISILSSKGASVVLLTAPYFDSGEQPGGGTWPEDDPSRVDAYNAILRQVAQDSSGFATVVDLGALVSPSGRFSTVVDGVDVRSDDGIHFTRAGGRWVGRKLLPILYQLGRAHHAGSPMGTWPEPTAPQS